MTRKANSITVAVACALLAVMPGCTKKEQAVQKPAAPAPRPPVQAPKPVQKQTSSVKAAQPSGPHFDTAKMKDPFKPYIVEQPKVAAAPPVAAVRRSPDALPIESYETSSFKVAGIIVGLKENSALVIDPTGKGYVVKPGMALGNNRGRITKITPTGIDVDEKYVEEGRAKRRTVRLTLPQKK